MREGMTGIIRDAYAGRRVMITGGLGFIGSSLARRLVDLGAETLVVDSLIPEYGGNLFNLNGLDFRDRVRDMRGYAMSVIKALGENDALAA